MAFGALIGTAIAAATGGRTPNTPGGSKPSFLKIGPVQFTELETPSEFSMPGSQSLAVHDHIGGRRVIQALGPMWLPFSWEGTLWDTGAQQKNITLMLMKASGKSYPLSWLQYAFDVVIKDYDPTHKSQYRIDYKITVEVLRDASGVASLTTVTSVDAQISAAVANATTHAANLANNDPNASALPTLVQNMATALENAGPAALATGNTAVLANAAISTLNSSATNYLNNVSTSNTFLYTEGKQLLAMGQLTARNFQMGQAPTTVTVVGGSLFELAAKYTGDASRARDIMQANGLKSPYLPATVPTTVKIPPYNAPAQSP